MLLTPITRQWGLALILFACCSTLSAQHPDHSYRFTIDLLNVQNNEIKVELQPPHIGTDNITYHLPKIIPGTYSEDDYGRYIDQFAAYDKKGNALPVVKADVNSWTISHAGDLGKIAYLVRDSYHDGTTKQVIFEPAGSNIQTDSDYVINNHCFLGYFDDMKNLTYEVNVLHPARMYGSTALTDMDKRPTADRFMAESYNRIVDNPIMYDVPDTATIRVGNTDVLISIYSPSKKVKADFLAKKLYTLLQAQGKYLGGKLPVDKYAFIIYLDTRPVGYSGGQGALEHSYCSMYYYSERSPEQLAKQFVDDAAHEFFHILTPLTIHSQEIQNFDFNHPKMSMHLWLYEGSTEYHAHRVQVRYGLISPDDFLKVMSGKITNSRNNYNDTVPFTVMSSQILGQYKDQFINVYQKGALINMCLDIKLLQLSKGTYDIMNLIHDLSRMYGKQRGFDDTALFSVIEKLTYPEIRQFLDKYVAGSTPLPFAEILDIVGVKYEPLVETKDSAFTLGRPRLAYNAETKRFYVTDTAGMNAVGRILGFQKGDELMAANGVPFNAFTQGQVIGKLFNSAKVGDSVVLTVMRKEADGSEKPVDLSATMTRYPIFKYNVLSFEEQPTAEQLMLRNAWLHADQ